MTDELKDKIINLNNKDSKLYYFCSMYIRKYEEILKQREAEQVQNRRQIQESKRLLNAMKSQQQQQEEEQQRRFKLAQALLAKNNAQKIKKNS